MTIISCGFLLYLGVYLMCWFPYTGVKHEELVSLAKSHFSGVSFEYEGDAVPVLSPCRFTGSEVRYVIVLSIIFIIATFITQLYSPSISTTIHVACNLLLYNRVM